MKSIQPHTILLSLFQKSKLKELEILGLKSSSKLTIQNFKYEKELWKNGDYYESIYK